MGISVKNIVCARLQGVGGITIQRRRAILGYKFGNTALTQPPRR